ncbi:cytochrome P450 2D10-like isoform X2 [Lampris incognitus]|uniref:cytochrome P450 2D10-like isoform X2 n=1 Tax=Lampris incognitus TaxID=2546036 RepID=UPI0024B496B6|nr:cytochrome P450 2D10-like isoform X2 [Lampris incognitus]
MFGSLVLLWLAACLVFLLFRNRRDKNFPPGPPALPIFGNLLQLNLKNPSKDLVKLASQYGNVYSLFLGCRKVVIISGLQAMKEAFITKAADCSGRPQDLMINHSVQRKVHAPGIVLSDYSSGWREHRRFTLMTLRNLGMGKESMEGRILEETRNIVKILEDSVGKKIAPQKLFHNAASNIICAVLLGTNHNYNEFIQLFDQIVRENSKILNGRWAMIYDSLPMVRLLPLPFWQVFKNFKIGQQKVMELLVKHKKTRVPGKPRDFIDCYLDELDKRGHDRSSFSEDQLSSIFVDLHFAGSDTTTSTLLTAFLYLSTHPQIQKKCQQEIDKVMEGKDHVTFEDRHQMPYIEAVIHEVQRIGNIAPLGVFHLTSNDIELMGYSIPRGTILIPNMTSVLNEEGQWKFPHEFNPENFLNNQGEFVKPAAFMPFSIVPVHLARGRRKARLHSSLWFHPIP